MAEARRISLSHFERRTSIRLIKVFKMRSEHASSKVLFTCLFFSALPRAVFQLYTRLTSPFLKCPQISFLMNFRLDVHLDRLRSILVDFDLIMISGFFRKNQELFREFRISLKGAEICERRF
jgi:hypothetical protein